VLGLLLASLSAGSARTAHANGRFPASNAIVPSPNDASTLYVRVTFGLLATRDRARTWSWICERAIGFSGLEDPSYVVTKSGAIVAGLFEGLRVSRDGGCTWETVALGAGDAAVAAKPVFVDLTLRSDGAVVALSSAYDRHGDAGVLYASRVWLSTDDARTFVPVGAPLDPTVLAESIEVAPSDPSRVYVSAVRGDEMPRQGVLLVSSDGGKRWGERTIPPEGRELAPFIAAVDPTAPDRVYVRTSASPENPTRLLVTRDAGRTFDKLLTASGPLFGFALSADGKTIHAGGPDDGLFIGRADGGPLARTTALRVQCLGRTAEELWACSSEASGFVAGASREGGPTFEPRLHLRDIRGPLSCPEGSSVAKECVADWPKMRGSLGLTREETGDSGVGSDGGGGAPRDGGALRSDGAEPSPEPTVVPDKIFRVVTIAGGLAVGWFFFRAVQRRRR